MKIAFLSENMSNILIVLIVLSIALFFVSKLLNSRDQKLAGTKLPTQQIKLVRADGSTLEVTAEIARSFKQRQRGLMYRAEMSEHDGMLFIFNSDTQNPFWMKNTLIPLDMIFIDASGSIVFIHKEAQPCKTLNCKLYKPDQKYRYVLEVNGGWSDKNDIKKGDRLESIPL